MSGSLTGYMLVGPKQLDVGKMNEAIAKAGDTLEAAAEFIRWGEDGEGAAPESALRKLRHIEKWGGELCSNELELLIHNVTDAKTAAESFVAFWNGGDTDDSVSRDVGDKLVIFCGETCWGDEPELEGFRILKYGRLLGLFDVFGVE